jgi:hypothetical protein
LPSATAKGRGSSEHVSVQPDSTGALVDECVQTSLAAESVRAERGSEDDSPAADGEKAPRAVG